MKRLLSWLFGKRQPRKTECLAQWPGEAKGMTLNQILDYNLRAGRLVVGW